MATLTEGKRPGQFLLSEAAGNRSRDNVTIKSGAGNLAAGTVLGRAAGGTASAAAKAGGNTGTGAITLDATTPVLGSAKAGVYTARCITAAVNGGTFRVEDPAGNVIGDVAVGATFADDVKFVIADGATDFVVGDGFDITVSAASTTYTVTDLAATDESAVAAGILLAGVDATSAAKPGVIIARAAEVKGDELTWHASVDTAAEKAAKKAELAAAGIIVR